MPLFSFFLFVFVTSFTPGPNNIMAMISANQNGLKKTIRFCIGVGTGFFIIIILCNCFNLLLNSLIPRVQLAMSILGAAYMVYLALKIMIGKKQGKNNARSRNNGFFTGVLLQFVNPKGILYGLTVVATFVMPYHHSDTSLILYSVFLAFVGFMSTFSWSVFGSLFQKFLSKYSSQFNIVMGLLLIYSAVSILME